MSDNGFHAHSCMIAHPRTVASTRVETRATVFRPLRTVVMDEIAIQRSVSIKFSDSKPWVINEIQTLDGIDFVELNKRDNGFARFVTSGGGDITKMPFFDELRQLRTKACCDAIEPPQEQLFGDEGKEPDTKKFKRMANKMPTFVELQLPGFTRQDGREVQPLATKVKSSLVWKDHLAVELTVESLLYIKHAMLKSLESERDDSCKHSYWRKDRKCWIAMKKLDNGKVIRKHFKPVAKHMIKEWLASAAAEGSELAGDEDGEGTSAGVMGV